MSLDPQVLEILVCPEDKGALVYVESEGVLLNERLLRTYPVRDDIPVMLIDEASQISDDEVQRLLAIAAG
ncbi:Trm112 family protein [Actinomycetota bacterium]|nr:Trm112 family protein [Actinomycetota bacterium]